MRVRHVHQGFYFMTSFNWISVEGSFAWVMCLCPWQWLLSQAAAAPTQSQLVKKLSCSRDYVTQTSVGILMESGPHASVCVWGIDLMTHALFSGRLHWHAPSRFGFHDCLSERRQKFVGKLGVDKQKTTDQSELNVVWSLKPGLDCIELKPFQCKFKRFG